MVTGWRRAFCTSDPESTIDNKCRSHSPTHSSFESCVKSNNPSTSTLQQQQLNAPKSNLTSPRSPNFKLFLFKNSFKSRSSCGMCLNSVKTGQGTAIYTAECGHAFHFPCIATHGTVVCPVCNTTWKDAPLLQQNDDVVNTVETETNHLDPPRHQPNHSNSVRSYDDDEPLPSILSGTSHIVPIPEANENGEEEDENDEAGEFHGFFVNPKPPQKVNDGNSRSVRVNLMPECAVISVSQSHETYALVLRVKAPPPPSPPQRSPMDIVTVLDVGSNMSTSKLHMLKRAMRLVISSLGSADRLAIVAFSASSKRLLPLRRMTAQGQRVARRVVDKLVCGQGNSVGEAMRKARKVLEDRRERNPIARIILLSDERVQLQTDDNNSNQRKCSSHVASSTRFNQIPVHSFGFGNKTGLSCEPLEDDFAIRGIWSVMTQDLRIQLGFSAPAEIRAVYSCIGRPMVLSPDSARLGDLYADEERELLMEVRVPTSALGRHHVMMVRCSYKDPVRQELVCGVEHALPVAPPLKNALLTNSRIERLRNVFITSRAVAESRRLAEHNEFSSAHHLLASAQALLARSGSASAEEYVRALEAELVELHKQKQQWETMVVQRRGREREMRLVDDNGEELTPTSAWRAAEKLANMAMMKKSLNRVSDLHGFENARF